MEMQVPEECYKIIADSLIETGFIGKVSKENVVGLSRHYLDSERLKEQIALIEDYVEIQGNFLEVGSGFGGLVTYINNYFSDKCTAIGIEPSADSYKGTMACTKVLAAANNIQNRFIAAQGEGLPFKSNSFDIVYSTSVLEHVLDPSRVIAESLRILKRGGIFQFVVPNYGSWWEGHYGILFFPHMPKWLFKLYVKILGRDPEFVDTLQFTTRKKMKKILLPLQNSIEILSWGEDVFEERLLSLEFSEWASLGILKRWVGILHKLKLVRIVVLLSRIFHWETPFVLTIRKT